VKKNTNDTLNVGAAAGNHGHNKPVVKRGATKKSAVRSKSRIAKTPTDVKVAVLG
jgi:hypothetical protein